MRGHGGGAGAIAQGRRRPRWWPGVVLLALAVYLLFEVAVRTGGFADGLECLGDVPYTPPFEAWQAQPRWSWLPLGGGCTFYNSDSGDVVVDTNAGWAHSLLVAAPTIAGAVLLGRAVLARTGPARRR